jgi:hypothetical protein
MSARITSKQRAPIKRTGLLECATVVIRGKQGWENKGVGNSFKFCQSPSQSGCGPFYAAVFRGF